MLLHGKALMVKDKKGRKYTLGGNLSDNLTLNYVRTDYKDATTKDTDSINLKYTWNFGQKSTKPKLFEFSSSAYELTKLGNERYALVQRENRIVKKKSGTLIVSGY